MNDHQKSFWKAKNASRKQYQKDRDTQKSDNRNAFVADPQSDQGKQAVDDLNTPLAELLKRFPTNIR